MARQKGSPTGRCQGCNHPERVRIERFLARGLGGAVMAIGSDRARSAWAWNFSATLKAASGTGQLPFTAQEKRQFGCCGVCLSDRLIATLAKRNEVKNAAGGCHLRRQRDRRVPHHRAF